MRFLSLLLCFLLLAVQPANAVVMVGFGASSGGAVNYGNETTGGTLLSTDGVNILYLYPLNETVSASGTLTGYTVNVRASTGDRKLVFALYISNGDGTVSLVSNSYTYANVATSAPTYTAASDYTQMTFTPLGSITVGTGDYYIGMRGSGYPKVAGTTTGGSGYTTSLLSANDWPSSLTLSSLTASAYIPGKWYITLE